MPNFTSPAVPSDEMLLSLKNKLWAHLAPDISDFINDIGAIPYRSLEVEAMNLADKPTWDVDELEKMKSFLLGDCEYKPASSELLNDPTFEVTNKKNKETIVFSNRVPTCGELRGDRLRNELDALKEDKETSQLSLYDAINRILQDPEKAGFLSRWVNNFLINEENEFEKYKQFIVERMVVLASALIKGLQKAKQKTEAEAKSQPEFVEKVKGGMQAVFPQILEFVMTHPNYQQEDAEYIAWIFNLDSEQPALKTQLKQHLDANADLRETLENLSRDSKDSQQATAGCALQEEVHRLFIKYPQEECLLIQVLWQTNCLITTQNQPSHTKHVIAYQRLMQEVNKYPWGKMLGGLMLAMACAVTLALSCASGVGVLASIAILSPGILASAGLFGSGLKQSLLKQKVSTAMQDVITSTAAPSGSLQP